MLASTAAWKSNKCERCKRSFRCIFAIVGRYYNRCNLPSQILISCCRYQRAAADRCDFWHMVVDISKSQLVYVSVSSGRHECLSQILDSWGRYQQTKANVNQLRQIITSWGRYQLAVADVSLADINELCFGGKQLAVWLSQLNQIAAIVVDISRLPVSGDV